MVDTLNTLQSNAATTERSVGERDKGAHKKLADTVNIAARAQIAVRLIHSKLWNYYTALTLE